MKLSKNILLMTTLLLSTQLYGTIYEDAEDSSTSRWQVYDNTPTGAYLDNVYIEDRDHNAIKFIGSGTSNGYILGNWENRDGAWNNSKEHTLKWSMNFDEGYTVYVRLMTKDGARYIYYTPSDESYGKKNNEYIHIGLGSKSNNGTWQDFSRDLEADLEKYEPNNRVMSVNAFLLRGNGMVDDIELIDIKKNIIETMNAKNDESTLTLTMNGNFEIGSHGSFFIDTDNDSSTGYSNGVVKGVDYLVQDNFLYRYPNNVDGWHWDKISDNLKVSTLSDTVTSTVPLNMIDIIENKIKYIAGVTTKNWQESIKYEKMQSYTLSHNIENSKIIGARGVISTSKDKGKLFASPTGSGDCMSYKNACSIMTAISKLSQTNNVLFLRGGVYNINKLLVVSKYISGTANQPIIIESYPREQAILNGNATIEKIKAHNTPEGGIYIGTGEVDTLRYIKIRNIEITKMGGKGISLMRTKGITIEGCNIHHNYLSGITLYHSSDNIMIDNKLHNNSDEGLEDMGGNLHFDNGGNADGIAIDYSGYSNRNIISHNSVYNNSDDGIDNIGGIESIITYNLSYNNQGIEGGKNGGHGNGIGIKACGRNAKRTKIEYNIAYGNNGNGFECNENNGDGVIFEYNTAYDNGNYGFENNKDYSQAKFSMNISTNNLADNIKNGIQNNNSWEIDEKVPFISTVPSSQNFLKPKVGSEFENMGAYAK